MTTLDVSPRCSFSFISAPLPKLSPNQVCSRPQLRSCLTPSRSPSLTPSLSSDVNPTPSASRSTSFSSCASGEGWKRIKCVRWQEMNGCAVTSTHDTYSQEEYDRTPLEPPTQAERACVLPERGSRSLSSVRDCFLSDAYDEVIDEERDLSPSLEEHSADSYFLRTPPPTETCSEDGSDDGEETEKAEHNHARENGEEAGEQEADREWEECMERRRMMFARMCPQLNGEDGERHPEFEGYRSISATLVQLLKSVNCNAQGEADDERASTIPEEEEEEEDDNEADVEDFRGGDCGFGFTSLKLGEFSVRDHDVDPDTPSLVSSAESEIDCEIASPGGHCSTIVPATLISGGMGAEEVVLAAWGGKEDRERGRALERERHSDRNDLRYF